MTRIRDDMADADVRIEQVIYVQGAISDDEAFPTQFKDFCEDLPDKKDDPLYAALPSLMQFAEIDDYPPPFDVAERLLGTNGFIFQAATPVREWHANGCSYSWGHYYTAWLHASSEAEIAPVAIRWAEDRAAEDKLKLAAAP